MTRQSKIREMMSVERCVSLVALCACACSVSAAPEAQQMAQISSDLVIAQASIGSAALHISGGTTTGLGAEKIGSGAMQEASVVSCLLLTLLTSMFRGRVRD